MYKIAVVGDRDSVLGFKALGLEVCPAQSADEAREIIHRLAKENCAILYLTEQLAVQLQSELQRYKDALTPAIILIPGKEGSLGIGMANVKTAVERAAILCLGEYISERELPMAVSSAPKNNDAPTLAELQGAAGEEPISMTLDEMERAAILRTLQDTGDNKSEAARRLGITRATLHNKLRRYDME